MFLKSPSEQQATMYWMQGGQKHFRATGANLLKGHFAMVFYFICANISTPVCRNGFGLKFTAVNGQICHSLFSILLLKFLKLTCFGFCFTMVERQTLPPLAPQSECEEGAITPAKPSTSGTFDRTLGLESSSYC